MISVCHYSMFNEVYKQWMASQLRPLLIRSEKAWGYWILGLHEQGKPYVWIYVMCIFCWMNTHSDCIFHLLVSTQGPNLLNDHFSNSNNGSSIPNPLFLGGQDSIRNDSKNICLMCRRHAKNGRFDFWVINCHQRFFKSLTAISHLQLVSCSRHHSPDTYYTKFRSKSSTSASNEYMWMAQLPLTFEWQLGRSIWRQSAVKMSCDEINKLGVIIWNLIIELPYLSYLLWHRVCTLPLFLDLWFIHGTLRSRLLYKLYVEHHWNGRKS